MAQAMLEQPSARNRPRPQSADEPFDNLTLTKTILNEHYRYRPLVLLRVMNGMDAYCANTGSTVRDYMSVTRAVRRMMQDVPAPVLDYFLAMMPYPRTLSPRFCPNRCEPLGLRESLETYLNYLIMDPPTFVDGIFAETLDTEFTVLREWPTGGEPLQKVSEMGHSFLKANRDLILKAYALKKDRIWAFASWGDLSDELMNKVMRIDANLDAKLRPLSNTTPNFEVVQAQRKSSLEF